MRLFIGINFQTETIDALISMSESLRSNSKSGKFTRPDNIHLTLAFLGECDEAQKRLAQSVMDEMVFTPFAVKINRLGYFRRNGGDIWWAGLQESKLLLYLQKDITNRLINRGFMLESRKYSPHITLARQVETAEQPRTVVPFGETVTGIDLIQSTRIKGKLTYIPVYRKDAKV